jgi:hypothetical protein
MVVVRNASVLKKSNLFSIHEGVQLFTYSSCHSAVNVSSYWGLYSHTENITHRLYDSCSSRTSEMDGPNRIWCSSCAWQSTILAMERGSPQVPPPNTSTNGLDKEHFSCARVWTASPLSLHRTIDSEMHARVVCPDERTTRNYLSKCGSLCQPTSSRSVHGDPLAPVE